MSADLGHYVGVHGTAGRLVVQPRMGMADPEAMAAGIAAVAGLDCPTVATVTIDSYTRVGDHAAATGALRSGAALNGFPDRLPRPERTALVAAAAGRRLPGPGPARIGPPPAHPRRGGRSGPVAPARAARCRTACPTDGRRWPSRSANWAERAAMFGELVPTAAAGRTSRRSAAACWASCARRSCWWRPACWRRCSSCSTASAASRSATRSRPTPEQDIEALAALRPAGGRTVAADVDWHIVLYAYMGVFPRTRAGAGRLLAAARGLAVRAGAARLIVKTDAEAHRIPTVAENVAALDRGRRLRRRTPGATPSAGPPRGRLLQVLDEARALVEAVLALYPDVGRALVRRSRGDARRPVLPARRQRGPSRGPSTPTGACDWAHVGRMPVRIAAGRPATAVTSGAASCGC